MPDAVRIIRADAPERERLEREGWVVAAHSWGARLAAEECDRGVLWELAARAEPVGGVRALSTADIPGVMALDASTLHDYPGAEATAHTPLTLERATVSRARRGYGVVVGDVVAAMTFLDVDLAAHRAEVDFTVVGRPFRGQGLATAVKAASVLDLLDLGVTVFRTGGSAENAAILAANVAAGFVADEEWVTLKPRGHHQGLR